MAALSKSHRCLGGADLLKLSAYRDQQFEFDESEVWTTNLETTNNRQPVSNPLPIRKPVRKTLNVDNALVGSRSMPVNVPDWSKILRGEYRPRTADDFEDDCEEEEDGDDGNDRMPPHEYLARTRVASFSVQEGVGRTLKGRDLSRVRNAIWKQTGFED